MNKQLEQKKARVLFDILYDLAVCKEEGWDGIKYIDSLIDELVAMRENLKEGK